MSSPTSNWSDRRGMFQSGKEKHEPTNPLSRAFGDPIRRASVSSTGESSLEKTTSNGSVGGSSGNRRRSSGQNALFNNLTTHKRGSEDYDERRASLAEMAAQQPGMVSGWYNKTFKGGATGGGAARQQGLTNEQKRGVME